MYDCLRLLGCVVLSLTLTFILACNREPVASFDEALPVTAMDPYVGVWVNVKDPAAAFNIRSEGAAYVVEDERGKKYVGTKADGVLRLSGPNGPIDILYAESSGKLIAAGDEYEWLDPKATAKVKLAADELGNTVTNEARSAGTHDDGRIRSAILSKARASNLPVDEQDISIRRTNSSIELTVEYTVPFALPSGNVYERRFRHRAANPVF